AASGAADAGGAQGASLHVAELPGHALGAAPWTAAQDPTAAHPCADGHVQEAVHPTARAELVLAQGAGVGVVVHARRSAEDPLQSRDRKSTRLNSSHVKISYAVFCL